MIKHTTNSHFNYKFIMTYQQFYCLKHQQRVSLLVQTNCVDTKLIYHTQFNFDQMSFDNLYEAFFILWININPYQYYYNLKN